MNEVTLKPVSPLTVSMYQSFEDASLYLFVWETETVCRLDVIVSALNGKIAALEKKRYRVAEYGIESHQFALGTYGAFQAG